MPKSKIQNRILFAISWAILGWTQVQAQPRVQSNQSLIFAAPPPPPDIGEPGRRAEAGSRGCGDDKLNSAPSKQLTALVPIYSESELVLGLTTLEHPTFWVYVPYQPAKSGQFVLRDKAEFIKKNERKRRIFTERFTDIVAPWARRTMRLASRLTAIGLASGGAAGFRLSQRLGLNTSRNTLLNLVSRIPRPITCPGIVTANCKRSCNLKDKVAAFKA